MKLLCSSCGLELGESNSPCDCYITCNRCLEERKFFRDYFSACGIWLKEFSMWSNETSQEYERVKDVQEMKNKIVDLYRYCEEKELENV